MTCSLEWLLCDWYPFSLHHMYWLVLSPFVGRSQYLNSSRDSLCLHFLCVRIMGGSYTHMTFTWVLKIQTVPHSWIASILPSDPSFPTLMCFLKCWEWSEKGRCFHLILACLVNDRNEQVSTGINYNIIRMISIF